MEDLTNLTPAQQARRYRELALETRRLAEAARTVQARHTLALLADQWQKLADEMGSCIGLLDEFDEQERRPDRQQNIPAPASGP